MVTDDSLRAVEELMLSATRSSVPLLSETTAHILAAGGKRLRPRLVLLAYEAVGGSDIEYVIPLAAAVEIIHTATLVHDDINDHGTLRRGRETVNARWGTTFALLTGDYMFTRTYQIMAPYSTDLNLILTRACIQLVEGETLQIQASKRGSLDRDTYFEIISKKTAALFVACAKLGATAAGASHELIDGLGQFAFNLGLAFQITDDVLDLVADAQQLGKNAGVDRLQGRGIAAVQKDGRGKVATAEAAVAETSSILSIVEESLPEEYTLDAAVRLGQKQAHELADFAIACLSALPPSPALDELRTLAYQAVERDH
jgi:octaprenyl-diphosphate synthase